MAPEYARGVRTVHQLTSTSFGGESPNVYTIDDADLLVQGYTTTNPGITPSPGEDVVTLPALLAIDAAAALDPNGMIFRDLSRMLAVCSESLFRLETLDGYAADRETAAYEQWLATGEVPTDDPKFSRWVRMVERHVAAGRTMRRVHVLPHTPSAALRFELAMQHSCSIPAGEEIRTVRDADVPDLASEDDFWLIDNRVGVRMVYDDHGGLARLDRMTTSEVERARHVRDRALSVSSHLAEQPLEVA